MQQRVATHVSAAKDYHCLNMNYGLCRIPIANIDAPALFNLFPLFDTTRLGGNYWYVMTVAYYHQYINEHIFKPLNIVSGLNHSDHDALAYPFPAKPPGWNLLDVSDMSGAAGWHLSVNDLLNIMAAFRRRVFFAMVSLHSRC